MVFEYFYHSIKNYRSAFFDRIGVKNEKWKKIN